MHETYFFLFDEWVFSSFLRIVGLRMATFRRTFKKLGDKIFFLS